MCRPSQECRIQPPPITDGVHQRGALGLRAFRVWGIRLASDLAAKRALRGAMRELHQLDDRMLKDIGVSRGEIEFAVRKGLNTRVTHECGRSQDRIPLPPQLARLRFPNDGTMTATHMWTAHASETDWLAAHIGLELPNPSASNPIGFA